MKARLGLFEKDAAVSLAIAKLQSKYGTGNPDNYPIVNMLDHAIEDVSGTGMPSKSCDPRLYKMDGENGRYEVFVMQTTGNMVPGTSELLAVLFEDSIPFDTEYVRQSSRNVHSYEIRLVDINEDGVLDLEFTPIAGTIDKHPSKIMYIIGAKGLVHHPAGSRP